MMPLCHDPGAASISRWDFLTAQPSDAVTLSLTQIAAIVGGSLPVLASKRWWWATANARVVRAQSWRAAGWDVTAVTWRSREWWVTFRRRPAGTDDNRA